MKFDIVAITEAFIIVLLNIDMKLSDKLWGSQSKLLLREIVVFDFMYGHRMACLKKVQLNIAKVIAYQWHNSSLSWVRSMESYRSYCWFLVNSKIC